ncbi:MAG TPA: shikimate dehydrogenase [Stellaceae bacterium]|nr:shikimate dehydrogenase [Stellaceae bacterium]
MATIVAGVMGWPIAHSRSPVLHGTWLARHGIAGAYVLFAVPPGRLETALRALPALGIAGANLTVPHKEAAARLVDRLDPTAARIGSVNMVTVLPDGTLEGASTDGYGFMENLRQGAPELSLADRPVVLLGAGGAARAIADELIQARVRRIRVVNRSDERTAALARDLGLTIEPWPWALRHVAVTGAALLANTTTLGMVGQPPLDLSLSLLPPSAVVTDIVYTPLETPLLAAARARGHVAVDGLGMLLHQARPAFARWFGTDPEVDASLRQAVLATLGG